MEPTPGIEVRPVRRAPREPLLLADFSNTTGEAVFDGALKDALEIQLQQSPYVKVLPTSQVRAALQLMQRPPGEPVTSAVARDLCERLGVKAILLGSIAPLSSAYVITLEAQACRTGDTLARDQAQAAAKTDVLATVGVAAARIRERLGESIGSIQKFNVPAPNATTPSLDALKAYSMGIETRLTTGEIQAIPFFEHALELDPNFALAAARLGAIYANLRDLEQRAEVLEAGVRAQRLAQRAGAPLHQVGLSLRRDRPAGRCRRDLSSVDRHVSRTTGCRTTTCRRRISG